VTTELPYHRVKYFDEPQGWFLKTADRQFVGVNRPTCQSLISKAGSQYHPEGHTMCPNVSHVVYTSLDIGPSSSKDNTIFYGDQPVASKVPPNQLEQLLCLLMFSYGRATAFHALLDLPSCIISVLMTHTALARYASISVTRLNYVQPSPGSRRGHHAPNSTNPASKDQQWLNV
jgi:hypothetical protein